MTEITFFLAAIISLLMAVYRPRTLLIWAMVAAMLMVAPKEVRFWNQFHYWLNSKYYEELQLDQLYECVMLASGSESTRRDLTDYSFTFGDPQCAAGFSSDRWEQFNQDVQRVTFDRLPAAILDKGLNATPPWIVLGERVAQSATPLQVSWIDPALLSIAVGFMVWAFGWRRSGYAVLYVLVFYGTFDRLWGNFAQYSWLAFSMVGVSLFHRRYHGAGGAAIGVAAALGIFPAILMLQRNRQAFKGFIAAAVLMGMLGLGTSHGIDAYFQMLHNMSIHSGYIRTEPLNVSLVNTVAILSNPELSSVTLDAMQTGLPYHLPSVSNWWLLLAPLTALSVPGLMFTTMTLSRYYYTILGVWLLENPKHIRLLFGLNAVQLVLLGFDQAELIAASWLIVFLVIGFRNIVTITAKPNKAMQKVTRQWMFVFTMLSFSRSGSGSLLGK